MTVLERLKAAGYDPAVSMFPDSIGKAGSMECERVQIRTFFCRPRENEAAIGVTATAMTHFSDGSTRPYPDGWPRSLEASVTLYFSGDADFRFFGNVSTDLVGSDSEFRYRLLSRCIQDCKYFLGAAHVSASTSGAAALRIIFRPCASCGTAFPTTRSPSGLLSRRLRRSARRCSRRRFTDGCQKFRVVPWVSWQRRHGL